MERLLMGYNKYHNPYVKLQEWNIAVSKQSNVCWIGGISHQYLGKCISNDLLLCIHIPQSAHHETDSNSRIELDLFPIIDFGNWNRFPSLISTSPKPLIEATMNKVWGAGKSIFSAELKSGRWEGANKLNWSNSRGVDSSHATWTRVRLESLFLWLVTWLGLAKKWLATWLGLARKWLVTNASQKLLERPRDLINL